MGFEPTMTAYETIVITISLPRYFVGRVSDLNRISQFRTERSTRLSYTQF